MSRKAGRSRVSRSAKPAGIANDGVVARVVDRALENPAMSGGLLVIVLTATAIVSNALYLQTGNHPDPLFATRSPAVTLPGPTPAVPMPRSRAEYVVFEAPTPSVAPHADATNGDPEAALVTDVQRELARLGLYTGPIDGITGPRTQAAIAAYETAAGLAATGAPSTALLDLIRNPPPPPEVTVAAAPSPSAVRVDAKGVGAQRRPAAIQQAALRRRVQTALNQIGYGPIAVDGQVGAETANAVRRFELDNGLPITGHIGDRVVRRLVAIGAMQAL